MSVVGTCDNRRLSIFSDHLCKVINANDCRSK